MGLRYLGWREVRLWYFRLEWSGVNVFGLEGSGVMVFWAGGSGVKVFWV